MKSTPNTLNDLLVVLFKQQKNWAAWLDKNHAASAGVWLRLAKKASSLQSVSYGEALEAALCYGWIDGQKKSYGETSWLQKFTPRGARSIWSKINIDTLFFSEFKRRRKSRRAPNAFSSSSADGCHLIY